MAMTPRNWLLIGLYLALVAVISLLVYINTKPVAPEIPQVLEGGDDLVDSLTMSADKGLGGITGASVNVIRTSGPAGAGGNGSGVSKGLITLGGLFAWGGDDSSGNKSTINGSKIGNGSVIGGVNKIRVGLVNGSAGSGGRG